MKKFISVLMSVVMMMSVLSAGAYAAAAPKYEGISPMYESSDTFTSSLSLKNGVITCSSSIILFHTEKWISITQTVEKKSSSVAWSSTDIGWSISASKDSNYYLFSNSETLNISGEYRLKSEFVVENSNGKQETITKYSKSITV